MPVLEAETTVHRPPGEVFDALVDLRRYEAYSDHLAAVTREGDGGVGTEYGLRFEWWRVGYTVRSRVTAVERPECLDFEVTSGIAASGSWFVEPADGAAQEGGEATVDGRQDEGSREGARGADVEAPDEAGSPEGPVTRVRFVVEYDPDSVAGGAVSLPALVPLSWVVDKVAPLVEREAAGVVQRVVRDLEGSDRAVDLAVTMR